MTSERDLKLVVSCMKIDLIELTGKMKEYLEKEEWTDAAIEAGRLTANIGAAAAISAAINDEMI